MNAVQAVFDYIVTFGRPEMILSDNGSQFKANIFEEFNKMLGIKLKHTTVAHPEANSVSERINFSIKSTIKALMTEGYTFENAARIHESIYNSSFHNTIQTSPNRVHFGRELANITEALNPKVYQHRLDVHNDYYNLMNNLKKLYDKVHDNLITHQEIQNSTQHSKSKLRKLEIGDSVLLDKSNKFKRALQGPFTVIQKCSHVVYKIQSQEDPLNVQKIHLNRLFKIPKRKQHLVDNKNNSTEEKFTSQTNIASSADTDKVQEDKNNVTNKKKEKTRKSEETKKHRYNLRKIKGRD